MSDKLRVPKFDTEAEEAQWWFDRRDEVDEAFEKAAQRGELRVGLVAKRAAEIAAIKSLLDPEDVERAEDLAARHGVPYISYLKMLLHNALEAESKKLAS